MKHLLGGLLLASLISTPIVAEELESRVTASRDASMKLMKALKSAVTEAAQQHGPVYAIGMCNEKALDITQKISTETGMEIGRTSHKLRNPKNAPDAWEQNVLQDFLRRKAAGEDLKKMEFYEVVDENGTATFRYMKAIPVGGVCYNCHGKKLRPQVAAKLDELYPDDKARGFIPGDLRGAFTVKQAMQAR